MAYQWQTVEHAAVTLGMSTRTIARRIAQGKFETRLQDGRREVFINVDEPAAVTGQPRAPGPAVFSQAAYAPPFGEAPRPSTPATGPATASSQPAHAAAPFGQTPFITDDAPPSGAPAGSRSTTEAGPGYVTYSHPVDQEVIAQPAHRAQTEEDPAVEAALILAEDRARRAEMTLTVFHQSVTLATSEARRARLNSRIAWCTVAVLASLVTVAVGWTASKVTDAQLRTDNLKDRFIEKADEVEQLDRNREQLAGERDKIRVELAAQRDQFRQQLSAAESERARAEGRLQELQTRAQLASDEVKATRDAMTELKVKAARDAVAEKVQAPATAPTAKAE